MLWNTNRFIDAVFFIVRSIDFKRPHRHGVFITDDGYLISNYHVVKDATKVRLLTGAKNK